MKIALAGNPNSGKTTMYNALTGSNETVGNWAGVTVDSKEHVIKKAYSEEEILIVDLPGAYSMSPFTSEESITSTYIKENNIDAIINIVDAKNDAIAKVTNSDFSHAAICLDNNFNKLYSFNLSNGHNKGGFSIEDIEKYPKDNRLAVFSFFISDKDHKKISERVKMLADNVSNTTYSVINILSLPFKNINFNFNTSMICSQFVDSLLKMANVDITNKNS